MEAWASELSLARGEPMLEMVAASDRGAGGLTGMRRYGEKSWLSSHIDNFGTVLQ